MHVLQFRGIVQNALLEDLMLGDVTTDAIFSCECSVAKVFSKEPGILAGIDVAAEVFWLVDPSIDLKPIRRDGEMVVPGDCLFEVYGKTSSLLKAERTALNFLQRLCGIATATNQAVQMVSDTKVKIVDTRKTTPGLRILEKYAVRVGGGMNHRNHLGDMVMVKDNHIAGAGSITEAVRRIRSVSSFTVKVEVETSSLEQVIEALACGVDVIMLDNMNVSQMEEAMRLIAGRALVEASGGITLNNIRQVAQTGVDFISLGYLTHHNQALDLSLLLNK